MKNAENKKIEAIRAELKNTGLTEAVDMAEKLFGVSFEKTTCLHQKCQYDTYLFGFSIQISPRRVLYIALSKIGSITEIVPVSSPAFSQFEYDSRAAWFKLEKRTGETAYTLRNDDKLK